MFNKQKKLANTYLSICASWEKKKLLAGFTQVADEILCTKNGGYSDLDIFLCKMNGSFNPLEVKTNILGSFQIYVPGQHIRPL